jgi:predicted nucleic acid-binding protein
VAAGPNVVEIAQAAYSKLAVLMETHRNLDCDLADVAPLWLAAESGQRRILTVDARNFSPYRLPDRRRMQLVEWVSRS